MKFLCLVYEEERTFKEMAHDEWLRLREATLAYVEQLERDGVLIDARPLQSATRAATIRVRDGRLTPTDGPFAETKEQLGGFFLIEAANLDEAVRIASKWPSAPIGTIEVRPIDDELRTERRY
jgi:hypothetical protein